MPANINVPVHAPKTAENISLVCPFLSGNHAANQRLHTHLNAACELADGIRQFAQSILTSPGASFETASAMRVILASLAVMVKEINAASSDT